MKVTAKCTNFSGCLVAYRGEKIEVADGAPLVCPECGKPLAVVKAGQAAIAKIVVGLIAVAILAGGAFVGVKMLAKHRQASAEGASDNASEPPKNTLTSVTPDQADTSSNPPASTPDANPSTASTPTAPPPVDPTPPPPAKADNTPISENVRTEVLKRVDVMPNIPAEKKDKLYNAVRRARDMRRVIVVSFASGQQSLPASEKENVKNLLNSAEVMKFRDDLTAVFVVLGFADAKGDEAKNLTISSNRAKSVKDFMLGQCGVKNVTHDVAMGGSKLVDEQNLAKNRIVEIWAVLPQ
jgi:outer membrane protein OmpA-like peptidoglycan-associated protein